MGLDGLSPMMIGLVALGGYLLGSIPFGLIITRIGGAGDIREIGSGNIGATNVLRTGRKELALATLVLDAGKAAAAILLARYFLNSETAAALAGAAAFLGHLFPVWLGFKGGKGVATFFGVLLAAAWPLALVAAVMWIGVFVVSRISSLSALVAAGLTPVIAWAMGQPVAMIGLAVFMAVLIFIRHAENIGRLLKGREPRFGKGR